MPALHAALPHDVATLADPVVVNEHEAVHWPTWSIPGSLLVTFGGEGCSWDGEEFSGAGGGARPRHHRRRRRLLRGACSGSRQGRTVPRQCGATEAGAAAVRRRGAQPDPAL